MSRALSEDSEGKRASANEFGTRQLFRRPADINLQPVLFIKVFGDTQLVATGNGKFIFAVSNDMDTLSLSEVELYVTTVSSSGIVQCQVRNITQAVDMLSTRVQVDVTEFTSCTAATAPVIDVANADVAHCDLIAIDVDAAGSNARGLGIMLTFA